MARQTPQEITTRSGSAEAVNPDHGQIEALAYQLWQERGSPTGDDERDWFRAEEQLRNAESVQRAA